MNLKFLVVLTMVLCAFCVLPVNAYTVYYVQNNQTISLGTISSLTIPIEMVQNVEMIREFEITGYSHCTPLMTGRLLTGLELDPESNIASVFWGGTYWGGGGVQSYTGSLYVYYDYQTAPQPPIDNDYDIDIDLQEQTIELGNIFNLDQTFDIGSLSDRVVKEYQSYTAHLCSIDDLQRNYVKIIFDENYNNSEIYLSGIAIKETTESDFTTSVKFNYTYIPLADLQSFIQTYDYQSGNMVSGVNLSVYEVIDNGDSMTLGNMVYSSISAESQTILMLKSNTDYFVKNELGGYLSVKNSEYPLLNNEVGYLWSPSITNPLILYYSRLDPTAQYNVGFIVQDTSNNGLSGVSVTMDNSVTKITNSIGGVTFNNVSSGQHSFTFVKNGYQSAQITKNIQMQYATFTQTLFADNQIIQPTTQPTAYPTIQPTTQPTISPVEQPKNIADSVKYGLAKVFGVNSVDTINLIFALIIILFPAVIGGVITNQAMGFVAGGMIGFVFALAIGLIPIWVFFSMVMLAVIYLILTTGNNF